MYAGLWQYYIEVLVNNSEFYPNLEKIAEKTTNSGVLWIEIVARYYYASYLTKYPKNRKKIEKGIWILSESKEKINELPRGRTIGVAKQSELN